MADANANGESKTAESVAVTPSNPPSNEPEISNAEKKRRKQAEKAAKRAQTKAPPSTNGVNTTTTSSQASKSSIATKTAQPEPSKANEAKTKQSAPGPSTSHTRTASTQASGQAQHLPLRRRPSQSAPVPVKAQSKQVPFFSHLYGPHTERRRHGGEGISKDVHPEVMALGLQMSDYIICGSQARCIALLLALKSVIQSYTAPHGTALPHHLPNHGLSPHLNYLKSQRPFSVSQANAIRWLKIIITKIDPSASESVAKSEICSAIDTFIREKFTIADQVIVDATVERIQDGDVIVTYAKSAVVTQVLLEAKRAGKNFSVVVIDGRPLLEGKKLATTLSSAGIDVQYAVTSAASLAMRGATKCILGAHGVMGDGKLLSRVGTSVVAMLAKQKAIPVLVCAESVKFTERVTLDSAGFNEIAPEDDLVGDRTRGDGIQVLNLLYDTTPAAHIDMIVTEHGSIPPASAAVIQRISAGS